MKRSLGLALAVALFVAPAFAAKNEQNVKLPVTVKVGATQLPAGEYKVSWTGSGESVQVTIAQKGGASVTVPAKAVASKNAHNSVTTSSATGADVLQSIALNNVNLVLESAPAQGQ